MLRTKRLPFSPVSILFKSHLVGRQNACLFKVVFSASNSHLFWTTKRLPFLTVSMLVKFSLYGTKSTCHCFISVYAFHTLIFLKDKMLAICLPVSISFTCSPCWKTKRLPFVFTGVHFPHMFTTWKDNTLVSCFSPAIISLLSRFVERLSACHFHQCSFSSISHFLKDRAPAIFELVSTS